MIPAIYYIASIVALTVGLYAAGGGKTCEALFLFINAILSFKIAGVFRGIEKGKVK